MDVKSGAEPTNNGSNNRLNSASTSSVVPQATHVASRQNSSNRVLSAKYYDIASTILGGSGDVEEVFLNAAKNGNLAKLEQLLEQRETVDLDVDAKDKRTGNTALIWAAKRGHPKIVELLLRNGADATLCNYEAQTALETAFSPVRTLLLDWLDKQPGNSEKLLLHAAWQGNLAVVNRILHENPRVNVNCQNSEGLTPLMLVARDTLLFERLSKQLNRYYSPVQVVEQLLEARADIHVTDNDGRSSLHFASQSRASVADQLVSALISGGMDVELRDRRLFTPIHLASQLGNTSNVVALADGGSSVNIKGFAGLTPLHMTAYNDHQKTAMTLLSYGADVKITDERGLTPFDVAKTRRMKNMLKEAWAERDKEEGGGQQVEEKTPVVQQKNGIKSPAEERDKKKSGNTKKKPEVIFDSYVNNKGPGNTTTNNINNNSTRSKAPSQAQATNAARMKTLANVEKCKQAEKKILEEVEALKQSHPVLQRETTRMLGTSRNAKILPQIGRSSSPSSTRSGSVVEGAEEARLSWEELRQQMASRGHSVSDIKLGVGRQLTGSPMPGTDESGLWRTSSSLSRTSPIPKVLPPAPKSGRHRRSGSDSLLPNAGELVASCDSAVLPGRGKKSAHNGHVRNGSVRGASGSNVFITQQESITEDNAKPSSSEDNTSQGRALESPLDLARCRSFFKNEFILEESRPKEMHSGSDPTSSYSGSSLSSSSPRDILGGATPVSSSSSAAPTQPSTSRSLRPETGLETLLEQPGSQEGGSNPGLDLRTNSSNAGQSMRQGNTEGLNDTSNSNFNSSIQPSDRSSMASPAVPIIRTHRPLQQQRVRRRSEHSLSSSIESDKGVFNLLQNKPQHRPLGRAGSLKLADRWRHHSGAGSPAEESDLPSKSVSVHKSQSLDDISPRVQKKTDIASEKASDSSLRSQRRVSKPLKQDEKSNFAKLPDASERSAAKPDDSNSQAVSSWSHLSKTSDSENQPPSSKIKPFSGKVKMMASSEFDEWESYHSAGDRTERTEVSKSSRAKAIAEPKPSVTNKTPSRSKGSQSHQSQQSQGKISMVSKSCTNVGESSTDSADTTPPDSIRPQTVLEGPVALDRQNLLLEKSLTSAQGLNATRPTTSNQPKQRNSPSHQAFEDTPRQSVGTPHGSSLNAGLDSPESLGQDKLFVVSEESVRKSSASKLRSEERLAAAQAKFREAAGVTTSSKASKLKEKEPKAQAEDPKLKSASKASFIEKNLMRNARNVQAVASASKSKVTTASTKVDQSRSGSTAKPNQALIETKQENRGRISSFGGKVVSSNTTSTKKPAVSTVMGPTNNSVTKTAGAKDTYAKCVESNTSSNSNTNNQSKTPITSKPNTARTQTNAKLTSEKSVDKQQTVKNPERPQGKDVTPTNASTIVESPVKITFSEAVPEPQNYSLPVGKGQAPIQTPVIVNPFENFVNKFVKTNEIVTKDAVVKLKKTATRGGKKQTAASKGRPSSCSTRSTNSANKKGRSNKAKPGDPDSRPKSGKKTRKKSKQATPTIESDLTQDAKDPNTALISGIGWQLSTACADSSNIEVSKDPKYYLSDSDPDTYCTDDDGDDISEYAASEIRLDLPEEGNNQKPRLVLESARDNTSIDTERRKNLLEVDQRLREAFREKITEQSPRFLEMKWRQETQTELRLPLAEDDGFYPMNLDVTQHLPAPRQKQSKRNPQEGDYNSQQERLGFDEIVNSHQEVILGQLTPIPEGPSMLSRTTNAISEFDREMGGSRLSMLLDGELEKDLESQYKVSGESSKLAEKTKTSAGGESSKNAATGSTHRHDSKSRGKDTESSRSKEDSFKYDYTPSGKVVRNAKSGRDSEPKFSQVENPARNDNNNNNEEDLEDAIDEILSSTTSSLASTLKNFNFDEPNPSVASPGFGCHSLTDGDKSLLLRLRNSEYSSPFHAKTQKCHSPNLDNDELESPPTPTEEDIAPAASMSLTFPRHKSSPLSSLQKRSKPGAQQQPKSGDSGLEMTTDTSSAVSKYKNTSLSSSGQVSIKTPQSTTTSARKPPTSVRSSLQDERSSPGKQRLMRSSSTREISKREGSTTATNEEEAKQLARVINSFRHMELHASASPAINATLSPASSQPSKILSPNVASPAARSAIGPTRGSSGNLTKSNDGDALGLLPRPSSCAGRRAGRFHELKEDESGDANAARPVLDLPAAVSKALSGVALGQEAAKRSVSSGSSSKKVELGTGSKPHTARSDEDGITAEEEKLLEQISKSDFVPSGIPLEDWHKATAYAQETKVLRSIKTSENNSPYLDSRRGSLAGSECTVDSIKSAQEDTIQWKKGNVLGKGAFGTVWCGLTSEGQLIAVKQIELTTLNRAKAQREYEKVQEEVELLKTLEHVNIVGYLGTSLEDNIVSIFMQFIPGGSIASILARFGALDEAVFRRYTRQILEGVSYLHGNDVIHRDIKGANVMLMPNGVIKLIDFGCAKRLCINLSLSQAEILKSMKGTPYWMAPEVVNETGHGKKSDIWSVGCSVFEMATRKPPWADMNPMAAIFAIGSSSRPVPSLDEKFSLDARDFVTECLTRDQEKRPGADELLNHVFLTRKSARKRQISE